MDDNFRKSPVRENNLTKTPGDYCCVGEERVARRYEGQTKSMCHRQGDTGSDHDLYKLSEEKTSDEGSVTETDANDNGHGDVRPTCYQCDSCPKKYEHSSREYSTSTYGKCPTSHRPLKPENLVVDNADNAEAGVICPSSTMPNRVPRNPRNYASSPVNLPQALVAMRKLERLKELQRRRDYSERFYSQEIRRLIGENFFVENAAIVTAPSKNRERMATPATRTNDDAQHGTDQRNRGGGYAKELEPYGTMTTIRRLNCGCVEETTIPIFSTSIGHVKKCESHREQERPVSSKITPPYSQETPYRTAENSGKFDDLDESCQFTRARANNKHSIDYGGQYRNFANSVSRDLESWDERKIQSRNRRSPRNGSPVRTNSPVRKYSDTSSNG